METFATILVVEDHVATRRFLADNLAADGYEPVEAVSVADAKRLVQTGSRTSGSSTSAPRRDGLEFVGHVRGADRVSGRIDPDLPLLVLTGRGGELDRLRGFAKGCDDYVVKPFSYPELHARIGALLRRTERRPGFGRLRVGALELDPVARQAWLHGEPLKLSKKEFGLLRRARRGPDSGVHARGADEDRLGLGRCGRQAADADARHACRAPSGASSRPPTPGS